MNDLDEMVQLGAFEPMEAKRILPLLQAHTIPFEIEADHSALKDSTRAVQLYFGIYPEGSKLIIFVPESKLEAVRELLKEIFPQ